MCDLPACCLITACSRRAHCCRLCRYGLQTQPEARQVCANVKVVISTGLQPWCCTVVLLNRPRHFPYLRTASWEHLQGLLLRFLGYIFKYQGVQAPSLKHLLNPHLILEFVGFQMARGVAREKMAQLPAAAERVVTWLQVTGQLPPLDTRR